MWLLFLFIAILTVAIFKTGRMDKSMFLLIFLGTSGFQLIPADLFVSPIGISKPYDYAYISAFAIIVANFKKISYLISENKIARIFTLYLIMLLFVALMSVTLLGYPVIQTIQSGRVFVWPIFFYVFLLVPWAVMEKLTAYLFPVVIVSCFLYLLQPIIGVAILAQSQQEFNPYLMGTNDIRYLVTPDFLIFYILLCALKFQRSIAGLLAHKGWLVFLFGIMLTVQMVSFTRSAIVATVAGLVHLWLRMTSVVRGMVIAALFSIIAIGLLTLSTAVSQRFSEGLHDVSTSLSGGFLDSIDQFEGNFAYRMAHFYERASFVLEKPSRWAFGVGMVHEESNAAQDLNFHIGLRDIDNGTVIQVDSGDIAWSVIIIKTGLVGVTMILWILFASYFQYWGSKLKFALIYQSACIYYLIASFFSSSFTEPNLMIPLMFFLALAEHERRNSAI